MQTLEDEGGMERLKTHKAYFPPGLRMDGPATLHGLGDKCFVPSFESLKNPTFGTAGPQGFLELWARARPAQMPFYVQDH